MPTVDCPAAIPAQDRSSKIPAKSFIVQSFSLPTNEHLPRGAGSSTVSRRYVRICLVATLRCLCKYSGKWTESASPRIRAGPAITRARPQLQNLPQRPEARLKEDPARRLRTPHVLK